MITSSRELISEKSQIPWHLTYEDWPKHKKCILRVEDDKWWPNCHGWQKSDIWHYNILPWLLSLLKTLYIMDFLCIIRQVSWVLRWRPMRAFAPHQLLHLKHSFSWKAFYTAFVGNTRWLCSLPEAETWEPEDYQRKHFNLHLHSSHEDLKFESQEERASIEAQKRCVLYPSPKCLLHVRRTLLEMKLWPKPPSLYWRDLCAVTTSKKTFFILQISPLSLMHSESETAVMRTENLMEFQTFLCLFSSVSKASKHLTEHQVCFAFLLQFHFCDPQRE